MLAAALVAWLVTTAPGGAASDAAPVPRPVAFPAPELAVEVRPLPLPLGRPAFEPPPPPPLAPPRIVLEPPLPRFLAGPSKPWPAMPEGGSCAFAPFRGPGGLLECGLLRFRQGDLRGAREPLEAARDRGEPTIAALAHLWLGELAFTEGRREAAEQEYRMAAGRAPGGDVVVYANLGLAWLALGRGALAEAQQAIARGLAQSPPPPAGGALHVLEGVVRLLAGRPADALAVWERVAGGVPGPLADELLFWRGVAQARLGERDEALAALDRFLAAVGASHPLYGDAIVQTGWLALRRGAPEDAERHFLWAERAGVRPDLRASLRAGQVQAYLALRDPVRARDAIRLWFREAPRDPLLPAALLLLAEDAAGRGAWTEAAEGYRQLREWPGPGLDPAWQEHVTYRLGESLEGQDRRAEAESLYRELRDRGRVEAVAQRAVYRLALLGLRARQPAAARAEAEALLRAGLLPELREAALLLAAEAAARAEDPNRAARLFRAALQALGPGAPRAAEIRLALGWALYRDGDPEAALREWQEAVRQAPNRDTAVPALLAIAVVALQQGHEPQSLQALRELGRLAPDHPQAELIALDRGILLVRARAYGAALQELELLVPGAPRWPPAQQALLRRALGIARYHLADHAGAERQFRQAAHWAPAELSSWLGAGLAALAQNHLDDAERALAQARLAAAPEVAREAAYALTVLAVRRGDRDAFRGRASEFVERDPAHPYSALLAYGLVIVAVERGDLAAAEEWAQRLVRHHPQSEYVPDALVRVAEAARERPELARRAYRELVSRLPEGEIRVDARLGLAEAALALGDAGEAQQALEAFVAAIAPDDPRGPRALALLVDAYRLGGDQAGTLGAAERFLARYPGHPFTPAIQLTRGHLLLAGQRWEEAERALGAARDTGEPEIAAAAHVWLGELYRARDRHPEAIAAYLGATYLYPDTPWAARGLQGAAQSYLARGMPREASILLRKLAGRRGVEPALTEWARQTLAQLGPVTGEDPGQVLRKGAARP